MNKFYNIILKCVNFYLIMNHLLHKEREDREESEAAKTFLPQRNRVTEKNIRKGKK